MENLKNETKVDKILKEIADILNEVSKDEDLYVNYAKIYYRAMKFLRFIRAGKHKISY